MKSTMSLIEQKSNKISYFFFLVDSCYLSNRNANACFLSWTKNKNGNRAVICGSMNEVANDPFKLNTFTFHYNENVEYADRQKKDVWNMIAMNEGDQLRQRMAWALSQILVVSPSQVRSTR